MLPGHCESIIHPSRVSTEKTSKPMHIKPMQTKTAITTRTLLPICAQVDFLNMAIMWMYRKHRLANANMTSIKLRVKSMKNFEISIYNIYNILFKVNIVNWAYSRYQFNRKALSQALCCPLNSKNYIFEYSVSSALDTYNTNNSGKRKQTTLGHYAPSVIVQAARCMAAEAGAVDTISVHGNRESSIRAYASNSSINWNR